MFRNVDRSSSPFNQHSMGHQSLQNFNYYPQSGNQSSYRGQMGMQQQQQQFNMYPMSGQHSQGPAPPFHAPINPSHDNSMSGRATEQLKKREKSRRLDELVGQIRDSLTPMLEGIKTELAQTVLENSQVSTQDTSDITKLGEDLEQSFNSFRKDIAVDLQKLMGKQITTSFTKFSKETSQIKKHFSQESEQFNEKFGEVGEQVDDLKATMSLLQKQIKYIIRNEFKELRAELEANQTLELPRNEYEHESRKEMKVTKKRIAKQVEFEVKKSKRRIPYKKQGEVSIPQETGESEENI